MPLRVRSPKGRLNFFSGRRDSESSRQSELSRAFISHLESARIRKDHARVSLSSRAKSTFRCRITPVASETFVDGYLRDKWPQRKNLLAMKIGPDINDPCGASRGSMSRNCENSQNPAVYSVRLGRIERLLRPALRRHGFAFQWISSKRAADSQHTGCRW